MNQKAIQCHEEDLLDKNTDKRKAIRKRALDAWNQLVMFQMTENGPIN